MNQAIFGLLILAVISAASCHAGTNANRWTVVSRTNSEAELKLWVFVVLEHDGHKYYARCNNYKAGPKGANYGCELHVGMSVDCQWYRDGAQSKGWKGYDLICGTKRNDAGELDTYGENELLNIDRED